MHLKSAIYAALGLLAGPGLADAQSAAPAGAAACSGCHAPAQVGSRVPQLRGRDPDEIVAAMQEFRAGGRGGTIMNRIAKGFSDEETRAIAIWLGAQR